MEVVLLGEMRWCVVLFFNRIQKNTLPIVIGLIALLALSIVGASKLTITPDNRVFYGPANKYFLEFLEFESNFTPNNNILFVVSGPYTVVQQNYAEVIRWISERAWEIDHVIRVDSLASYPIAVGDGDSLEVIPLLDLVCPKSGACVGTNHKFLKKKQLVNRLVSPDLRSTGIIATLAVDIGVVDTIEKITADSQQLSEEFRMLFPEFELVVTGGFPMMQAFTTSSEADLSVLLPVALVLIFSLLTFLFWGFRPAILLVSIALASIVCTLGFAGWTEHTLNSASSIAPLVVFTLVITGSMHVFVHFLRLSSELPKDPASAARAAFESNLAPILVSAATTMTGLLSLSFLDSPPLQQLGYLSAIGVFVGTAISILILPITLSRMRTSGPAKPIQWIQRKLNSYARYVEHGGSYASIALLALSFSIIGLWQIEIDDDFVKYFSEETEFRQHTDRATELLAGPNHIEVLLENRTDNGIFDPNYISYLAKLTDHLRRNSMVSNVSSFSDILSDLSDAFQRSTADVQSADEFAQWYLVYELSLRRGQSNTDFVRSDHKQTRTSVLLNESTSADIQRLEFDIYQWHSMNNTKFNLIVTGENIPVAHLSELNIRAMVIGIALSIVFAAFLVGISVKKLRLGLITLVATIVPIVCGFGLWGLFVGTIGLASTAIIALTIGIVVDDAVHMVYRFLDARRRLALGPVEASAYSLHRVGTAISTTSLVMIGGLSVLLLSNFEINSSFGACTCLIIAIALFFDLLVLPRFLAWADRN